MQACYHQALMLYTTYEDILHPKVKKSNAQVTPEILADNKKVCREKSPCHQNVLQSPLQFRNKMKALKYLIGAHLISPKFAG